YLKFDIKENDSTIIFKDMNENVLKSNF
ncbi:hypothetical protein QWI81_05390, partial [Acinetobacter pittii]|nr:hypothetical protein [Acinetobacter pittii]